MYERLPLNYIGITGEFGTRKDPITGVSSYHYGVDFGWHNYQGEPVYAIIDSKVSYVGYDNSLGNYIVFTYDKENNTIIYRFFHLRDKPKFKIGETVKRGQQVGIMGTTGYSTGVHLHFEYWICPKGYKYRNEDKVKYAKNPLDYCYLFETQEVNSDDQNKVIKVVGTSLKTERDKTKNQIEIVEKLLRCRNNVGTNSTILGYIDLGIYDFSDVKENNGYKWYKIDNDKWVAGIDDYVNIYDKSDNVEDINQDKNINEETSTEENNTFDLNNYNEFISLKDGYYYIYLKKGEKIYYPK